MKLQQIFVLLCATLNSKAQVITATISPDQDYNAALGETSMIQFTCYATGTLIEWRVDRTPANVKSILTRGVTITPTVSIGGGVFFSSLSIRASSENDNTTIQCTTVLTDPPSPKTYFNASKLIFLNIQGVLGPPPNLTISEADENCIATLGWDAPETLDLTNIEPDILYYIVCHNLTGDMNCANTTSLQERLANITLCQVSGMTVMLTVAAVNVVGVGNTSSLLYSSHSTLTDTTSSIPDSSQLVSPTSGGVSIPDSQITEAIAGGILIILLIRHWD